MVTTSCSRAVCYWPPTASVVPTRDVDAAAVSTSLTPTNLRRVVTDIAGIDADDGVVFDLSTLAVEEIREEAEYAGLRLKVTTYISTAKVPLAWDVSTCDPIVPQARLIQLPRLLGSPVEMLGYPPEMIGYPPEMIGAEKAVTILQRGTTSTRWRDYVDIVQVARHYDLDRARLVRAVRAVAAHREVKLGPATPLLEGYAALSQPKWAAWRRKAGVEEMSEESLDSKMNLVCAVVDSVLSAAAALD